MSKNLLLKEKIEIQGGYVRVFPVYAPKLIVKHARIFFNGVVWIKGLGRIEFQQGKFLLPKETLPKTKKMILELNSLIKLQNQQTQSAS